MNENSNHLKGVIHFLGHDFFLFVLGVAVKICYF